MSSLIFYSALLWERSKGHLLISHNKRRLCSSLDFPDRVGWDVSPKQDDGTKTEHFIPLLLDFFNRFRVRFTTSNFVTVNDFIHMQTKQMNGILVD